MTYLNDPSARARSYVARRAGMQETALLERRIAALEQAVQAPFRGQAETVPPEWTMIEILTELPQPSADMVGRIAVLRRANGFATLNVCIFNALNEPEWALAMALATTAGGGKTGDRSGGGIASVGGVQTYVPSPTS